VTGRHLLKAGNRPKLAATHWARTEQCQHHFIEGLERK
jgi:hypothetical protein